MRCVMLFFFMAIPCWVWGQLPSFESSHLQNIWVDKSLKGFPEQFSILEYNYDPETARLAKSAITKHYFYSSGKLVKVEFRKGGTPETTYEYDTRGRITEQIRKGDFESIPRIAYNYDDNNLLSEEVIYRLTGTVHSKTRLRYNDKMKLVAKEEFQGSDRLTRYWLYHYNEQDDLVSEEYFDLASTPSSNINYKAVKPTSRTKLVHEYDTAFRPKQIQTYKNDLLVTSTRFHYAPDSVVKETTYFQSAEWPSEKHVEINNDSARVLIKGFYKTGDTTSFRSRFKEIYVDNDLIEYESRTLRGTYVDRYATFYEYDHKGNWIKKTTYSNGITIKVKERKIRY
jgi:YD repeat-containing protein